MVKKSYSYLIVFLFVFAVIPLVSSAPPFITTGTSIQGYDIKIPSQEYIKQNQDYTFYFHLFNISDGLPVSNVSIGCKYHLYNSSGNHILETIVPHYQTNVNNEWEMKVLGGNFSKSGTYNYIVQCNSSVLGGFSEVRFVVTGVGFELTTSKAMIYSIIILLFIFLFIVIMLGINKLPSGNDRDESGQLMSINNLKYFRSVLLMFEYLIIVSLFFLASNLASEYLEGQLFFKLLFTIFQILAYMILPIIIVWVVWIFAQIIDDKRMRRLIEHGIYEGKGGNW